ncbi:MAG: aminotransferase class I/II-fold pyridoxal phosphate-dependent enzyme, partial [Bacteroidetes bacterium]|nr:aminotransferase class I/II-fold pyridoxal phosphate-dependent enzyme [Bacteroidota bacterium]
YAPTVTLCGGTPIRIALDYPDFKIGWKKVEAVINSKTKLIIINYPNNPTGTVISKDDMLMLESIVQRHGLYVVSDEVYEHLVYDGQMHESVLKYEGLYQRSIVTYSFGKTFHNTGWKVGYAIAPPALMNEFKKVHQFVVFSVNRPVQMALADYMSDPSTYLDLAGQYQEKRDYFISLLQSSKFRLFSTAGTYFQLADYSAISNLNDLEFARQLTIKYGVASIPVSPFFEQPGDQKLVRFCFAKTNDILEQAADKLCKI